MSVGDGQPIASRGREVQRVRASAYAAATPGWTEIGREFFPDDFVPESVSECGRVWASEWVGKCE